MTIPIIKPMINPDEDPFYTTQQELSEVSRAHFITEVFKTA